MLRSALLALCLFTRLLAAEQIDFQLQSPQGSASMKDFAGKHVLLSLGYTSCPDICPTTLYEMAQALKALPEPEKIQMIFVSIDPVNDEIHRLNAYTQYFDSRILGLTGEMAQIEDLADQLGATFGYRLDGKKVPPQKGQAYTVYHSTLLYLISPTGELLDVYDYQLGAAQLTQALSQALAQEALPSTVTPPRQPEALVSDDACPLPQDFKAATEALTLSDISTFQQDKPVFLLNLWAWWCAPCRQELPLLEAFVSDKVQLEALHLGEKTQETEAIVRDLKLKRLKPHITPPETLSRLQAQGLPFTALFVDGRYHAFHAGLLHQVHLDSVQEFAHCLKP